MATCTFFGDSDMTEDIKQKLNHTLINLIENYNANWFYVGNENASDLTIQEELKNMCHIYPHIYYEVIVCNIPQKEYSPWKIFTHNLCLVNGIKGAPKEKIVEEINNWMLKESDCVITYIQKSGELREFKEAAERNGKTVINLYSAN